jgi:predicted ATPase
MIGANGTGKTSILDVLSLLASSAQGKLASSISELSGLADILTNGLPGALELEIANDSPTDDPLKYTLRLRLQGFAYQIDEETLSHKETSAHGYPYIQSVGRDIVYLDTKTRELARPTWQHKPLETTLAQVPRMYGSLEDFRERLASSTFYHALNVDPRSPVRLPQPMAPAELPGKNGEDLASCLYNLRETNRDRYEAVEDSLRAAFPRFERLDFPLVAAGTVSLAWRETGTSKPFYAHQLSEGTLRFLWLTTLLQSPGLTALTLLDEPEVSLHPELLSLLADQLREASQRSQIVVATHSDTLIRFLQPSEVVVLDSTDDGMTTVKRADELDLGEWLKDYSLDELWRNGRIGARA